MTEPSPYEQGFRDALLTLKATLDAAGEYYEGQRDEYAGVDSSILNQLEAKLEQLIDQKNHDLWQLFAVAQTDLTAHPEALALRSMMHAPSGVLIDSAGRMLFVRLAGTDYDTGVLALMDEVAHLKAREIEPWPEMMTVIINGKECRVLPGKIFTYEDLCAGAVGHTMPGVTVTFRGEGMLGRFQGTLTAGGSIVAAPGMVFNVVQTGSA